MLFQVGSLLLDLLLVALGALALWNGRRYYWIFVGIGGAALGLWLSDGLLANQSDWLHVLLILLLGIGGAWFSFRYEQLATRVATFLVGAVVLEFLLIDSNVVEAYTIGDAVVLMIGGLLGLGVQLAYGDRSLVVLSSFVGAGLVVTVISGSTAFDAALFSGLAAVGMLLQSRDWIDNSLNTNVTLLNAERSSRETP